MAAIAIRGVTKQFLTQRLASTATLKDRVIAALRRTPAPSPSPTRRVLDAIDLEVEPGSVLGLIGGNGSGKSTLLRIIAGIYRAESGSVEVAGRVAALIELGAGFHPEFSGRENIRLNAMLLGLSREEIRARFDEIVAFAGVEQVLDAPVRTYSSGMLARLGFSIAVHAEPDVLLSDEVFAVGDAVFMHRCRDKMDDLKRRGKTIVLVTHDLTTVESWCNRAAWLEAGRLRSLGSPAEVVAAYRAYVAEVEGKANPPVVAPVEDGVPLARRWGDGRVQITAAAMHRHGKPATHFTTGDPVRLLLSWRAERPVEDPVFGVAIIRRDGLWCWGTNTDLERLTIPRIAGEGTIAVTLESLDLLQGAYYLDVAVHDRAGHAYDYHSLLHPFWMRSQVNDTGLFRPRHVWHLPAREVSSRVGGG